MVGGIGFGVCLSFVALLVVGTYSAAAGLASAAGNAVGLAKGAVPSLYQPLVQKWGAYCPSLNPAMLAAQLYSESGWKTTAVSPVNAQGIAQFMPATWATHGIDGNGDGKRDIWDPADAIPSAASYDCELARHTSRTCPATSERQHAGRVQRRRVRRHPLPGGPAVRRDPGVCEDHPLPGEELGAGAPSGGCSLRRQAAGAIYYAQQKLGTPYLWGGEGARPSRAGGSTVRG